MTNMQAALFTPGVGFSVEEVESLPLLSGEIRVRVDACGVCGSDRQLVRGESVPLGTNFPLIMGHEIAGTVVELGQDVDDWTVGDDVVVCPFIACGSCTACENHQSNLCVRQICIGYQRAGGFAEHVIVPATQLIHRPAHSSAVASALLVDAFATPYHALKLAGIQGGETMLVIGTGGLGLATLLIGRALQVRRLGAVTRRQSGVDIARTYGAETALSTQDDARNVGRQLRRWGGASGIDVIVDTVADAQSFELALDVVRPGGTVAIVGMSDDVASFPVAKTVRRGVRVITSYGSVVADVRELMDMTELGLLNPSQLVAGTMPLAELEQAFSDVRASGRWVIQPNR